MIPTIWINIGLLIAAGFGLLLWYRAARTRAAAEDLLAGPYGADPSNEELKWRAALAEQIPMMKFRRDTMRDELRAAGFYHPDAVDSYAAFRNIVVGSTMLFGLLVALLVPDEWMLPAVIAAIALSGLSFSLPYAYLVNRMRKRKSEIEKGLPVAIDLLAVSLGTGQDLRSAISWVGRELKSAQPVIADEFRIVSIQAGVSNLEHALQQCAERTQTEPMNQVVRVLVQSQRLGTDITTTLKEMAASFRSQARQRAEARANRLGFWMLLPNIFCLFLAAAIAMIGPVALEFASARDDVAEILSESREGVETIDQPADQAAPETGAP